MAYANKAVKQIIVQLAACTGFADVLLQCDFRNKTKAKRSLQAMFNHAQKAMDAVIDGLDQEQVEAIIRFAKKLRADGAPEVRCTPQKGAVHRP